MNVRNLALLAALTIAPAAMFAQAPAVNRPAATIQQRKVEQQKRIATGVRTGQLTRRETAHLERYERGINRQERVMRARDGGRLTRHDRRVINRRQNRVSRRIYRDKHNRRVS